MFYVYFVHCAMPKNMVLYSRKGDSIMSDQKNKFDKVAYNNSFISKAYDRINLTVPKGDKEKIKAHADHSGESVNAFINRAIQNQMERDSKTE